MDRIQILWNQGWKFMHGDFPDGAEADFDDSEWYDIGLPHSFGIPYFMEHEFYVGYGCYRKWLKADEAWLGRQVLLEFQGVFQEAEVYVNGRLAGAHKGGYTAFVVDITQALVSGENLVFVRVNNLWNPRLAPRAGEHVFNGGIYRDVSLIVTDRVHVAWYGTFVTTPEVSKDLAAVEIATEVENGEAREMRCKLLSVIRYGDEEVARTQSELAVEVGETKTFRQKVSVLEPKLWSPETPRMYRVETYLYADGALRDRYETDFGIRWFEFTADRGFFLNGEHYDIHGANVHQDHAGWSDAVTHTGIARDIGMVKECGMNFIRGSHYPHHTFFAEECDRQGVLFWSENCFWGTGGPKVEGYWTASAYPVEEEDEREFEESCARSLTEMIRANRNHPSIIVWSMCNEPFFTDAATTDKAKALLRKLVELSHGLDPTRPAAIGGAQRGGFDVLGDLAGYNGDGAAIFHDPGFPNFVSEYGSTAADRPGAFEPRYTDGVEIPHAWRSGKSLWCAFHHGSILYDMGHMGIIDYHRLPLDAWYWYREHLAGKPRPACAVEGVPHALTLTADRTVISDDGTKDAQLVATLRDAEGRRLSNPCQVTLSVVSGGGRFPTGTRFVMSPEKGSFLDGLGAIELRGLYGGDTVIRAEAEGVIPAEIRIHVEGEEKKQGAFEKDLLPPPSLMGAPKREERYEIGINRPVFCSSAAEQFPARNVTDGSWDTCWRPAEEGNGEWIMVDMEGTKEIREIRIVFAEMAYGEFEVSVSKDREGFERIYSSGKRPALTDLTLMSNCQARFIRLRFLEQAAGVRRVEIM